MAREVVLDANVIVAQFDAADVHAARARVLIEQLRNDAADLVLLDVLVAEAVSVLCRRARERKSSPPDLAAVIATIRTWAGQGAIRWTAGEFERLWPDSLAVIESTAGRLNFNDALLVTLQREGSIGEVASFDAGFDAVSDFRRIG